MTIAITGATGFVGQAVLDEAARWGLEIRALTRREQAAREGVEWVRGDLSDEAALARLCDGAEAILHIAGVVNAPDAAGFQAGNVEGTRALLEAAQKARASRFICVSSLAARAPELSQYGRSKREAEDLVKASKLKWTIIRPPGIYGPRDVDYFEMFRSAKWGFVPLPPRGASSLIHVDDLARLLLTITPSVAAVNRHIFEPDDGREGGWSHRELAKAIGRAVGRRVYAPNLPAGALAMAARFDRALRGSKARLTADRVGYMVHPNWVVSSQYRVPAELWQPQIDTEDGLAQTAKWYREKGWL